MYGYAVMAALFAWGCTGSEPAPTAAVDDTAEGLGCRPDVLEDDFVLLVPGPAGDPTTWPALPPDAVVSSTYLQIRDTPEARAAFDEASGPVFAEISAPASGLMGASTGSSVSCGTARTLTAWATEADMMAFVTGPAHAAAIPRISEISRGGSITWSWTRAELDGVDWGTVAAALAAYDGPRL